MREAVSSIRVNATVRAVRSVGALATSENEFSISLMAAPKPLGAAREDVLKLVEFVRTRSVRRLHGSRQGRLACQEIAEIALNGDDVNTLANVATARELTLDGLQSLSTGESSPAC